MTVKNAELEELVKEQTELQMIYDNEARQMKDRTNRHRSIRDYEVELFRKNIDVVVVFEGEKRLNGLLDSIKQKRGKVVWADLGCGHAIALREGKQYFEEKGALEKLITRGYDAIPVNADVIKEGITKVGLGKGLIDRKYAPKIIQADIATAVFEEKPDLVTAVNVLFWTKDPLQVFANAARQMRTGGVICFNNLINIKIYDSLDTNLFQAIIRSNNGLPGFKIIPTFGNSIVARKVSEQKDYTYGFRLVSRHRNYSHDPFTYVYTSDSNSRGRKREF